MIDLYETDFPGMYMTEDGYYISESGDIYDEDGTLLELGTAEVVPISQAGAGWKTIDAQPVRDGIRNNLGRAARFAQNHKGKVALGVAGTAAAAYGAKKLYNRFKKRAANESFDLYETDMPGIYMTEDGYLVDTDGDLYDQDGDLIEENAVVLEGELVPVAQAGAKAPSRAAKIASYAKNHKGKVALGVAGTAAAAYGAKKLYNRFKKK